MALADNINMLVSRTPGLTELALANSDRASAVAQMKLGLYEGRGG